MQRAAINITESTYIDPRANILKIYLSQNLYSHILKSKKYKQLFQTPIKKLNMKLF